MSHLYCIPVTPFSNLATTGSTNSQPRRKKGVTLLKNHVSQYHSLFSVRSPIRHSSESLKQLAAMILATGRHYDPNSTHEQVTLGDPYSEKQLEGLTFRYSPQTFIQNHPEQSANIYREICRLVATSKQTHMLDLYCGFGMTTLLLAQQGTDRDRIKPQGGPVCKRKCCSQSSHKRPILSGECGKYVTAMAKKNRASMIIVNPPRQGLSKDVSKQLLKVGGTSIILCVMHASNTCPRFKSALSKLSD